jgi:hypothetical protein
LTVAVSLLLAVCSPQTARGNPVYYPVLFAHVQPLGAGFCDGLPVSSCAQITQRTATMGWLEFDLIMDGYDYLSLDRSDISITVAWPEAWGFLGVDVCGTPPGSFQRVGAGGVIRLSGYDGLPTAGRMTGLARIGLNVTTPGSFEILAAEGYWSSQYGAWAGPTCGDCVEIAPCDHHYLSRPTADLDILELRAPPDSTAAGTFLVHSTQADGHGTLSFIASEPWITVDAELAVLPQSPQVYEVTVSAGGGHRDPGVYEGWVEMRSDDCHACLPVILTVRDHTPPAAQPESWGSLKNRFREPTPNSIKP